MKAAVAAVFVLLASLTLATRNFGYPYAVYGGYYSDHFSHMGSTLMFLAKGLDVYRKPVRQNLMHSTQPKDILFAHENQLGTKELFVNPLDPSRPPLAINWSSEIRAYPPGVYALFLPVAALFHFEKLSFKAANRVIILSLVAVAGACTFLLFWYAFLARDPWARGMRFFSAAFACYWIQCWALRGFYDVVSILFVLLSLWALDRKRWLDSFAFYCCAVFIHYRALYYAPVSVMAAWLGWQEARRRGRNLACDWARRPRFWLALALAAIAGICFVIALPRLESFFRTNPLYHFSEALSALNGSSVIALCLAGLTLALMAAAKDWASLVILSCYLVFLVRTPQTYPWHSLFLLPLLVFCSRRSGSWLSRAQWASMLALGCWYGHFIYGIQ